MKSTVILLLILTFGSKQIYSDNPKVAAMKMFKALTNPDVYDKDMSPQLGENAPVTVNVTMYVIEYEHNPLARVMNAMVYFRQRWTDRRLSSLSAEVIGSQSLADRLWIPDTFFSNAIDVKVMSYPTDNVFVAIYPGGGVHHSQRIQLTLRCKGPPPQTHKNTKTTDICLIDIESYGHNMTDIEYDWGNRPNSVGIVDGFDLGHKFLLAGIKSKTDRIQLSTGKYSKLMAEFEFVCRDCSPKQSLDAMLHGH
ncbi:unnamed protein product [Medioppia subpectinata]|uniref:Neurotransmitter-gated ion-channel ligand-binding domain-containing protein n=1 Tax=Medioppia subpectinata TaxID=1979941 RepID=A0A7R9QB46_9ACAR|nr:unnamed protein product [Medioppia subpectinata]CAG2117830.1 unnamed protein product [Medioppia subpectinata]